MDKDCATIIIATCAKAARELGDVVGLVSAEDQDIKLSISAIIYDIMQNVVEPIQNNHLDLKDEISKRLERYGRVF